MRTARAPLGLRDRPALGAHRFTGRVLQEATAVADSVGLVTDAVLAHLSLERLLDELLTRVRTALAADTATILLVVDDGKNLEVRASHGIDELNTERPKIPVGKGIVGRIAKSAEPIVVNDVKRSDVAMPGVK